MRRIVVAGYGMAGHHLVAGLIRAGRATPAGDFELTVLGAEAGAPYNRVLLPEVLAGRIDQHRIDLPEADDPRVTVRAGVRATGIDRERRLVTGDDGSVLRYDALVLATGANPVLPPLGGILDEHGLKPGVHTLRTLADLERIQDQLAAAPRGLGSEKRKPRAVVVGGGLLGVQCARGLTLRGADVVLIHQGSHLLDHRLDAEAAAILSRTARGLGIEVHVGCRARAVLHERDGRLGGVQLADGFQLDADLVLLACGSAPATALAARAGLAVDQGVLVDERLASVTDPCIHAIGDCARVRGGARGAQGLAAPALEQAEVLAERLLGRPALYQGSSTVARLTATGVDVAILAAAPSLVAESRPDHVARTVRLTDPIAGTHRAVTVHGGRVVSSVLIGDVSAAARLTRLVDRPGPLPENPIDLLFDTAERN
ncbi:NAD(P)/FAD-dependent oxidoreductase [Actinocrinis puniceicyclus]|uniref:NAD(P)/FAD-dependent oxidoreductase n=1 Tax=Actinocrinis puniceicyclus TaxID=977794 RepID=A0A8J8BBW8_9ACTN|nr:FAD-dependent oxidoreductase [Actinocrinis puniceicyclus]MBS2962511.1 NAD(P)/FAD-dependent oxidoreductase [Actinocrinis puniceicyclus]